MCTHFLWHNIDREVSHIVHWLEEDNALLWFGISHQCTLTILIIHIDVKPQIYANGIHGSTNADQVIHVRVIPAWEHDGIAEMHFTYELSDVEQARNLLQRVQEIDGVFDASRTAPQRSKKESS